MGNAHNVLAADPAENLTTLAECERLFAEVLADIVGAEHVSVDSNFFDDLGADSMLMARFCARVRKRTDLPSVSMPDIYKHPTIRSLAAVLATDAAEPTDNRTIPTTCERLFAEVLADIVGTEHVSVDSHFFDDLGADSMLMARFCARVRKRTDLPAVSMPDIYKHPTIRNCEALTTDVLTTDVLTADPADNQTTLTDCERRFADVLADIVGTEHVSVDSHFFDDLGADSMLMARFCARVRKRADLPTVSMPDIYKHPTIRSLAAALAGDVKPRARMPVRRASDEPRRPARTVPTQTDTKPTPASLPATPAALIEPPRRARNGEYVLCGALQLLFLLGYPALTTVVAVKGYEWVAAGSSLVDIYLRSVAFSGAMFLGLCTLPILLKWVLIGRWKPQEIRVWSMAYFRFWLVKTLVQRNPMALFVGSPLYALYLRALGAKVGRGAVILSRNVPVCTDLLSIGDGAVIRKDSFFNGYRAHDGVIQTGAVSLGKDALVGEMTVLDIWTSLGDGAQLGHSSSLHAGQAVPDGERWHGSPAQPTDVDYQRIPTMDVSTRRRVVFATVQLVNLLLLGAPLTFVIVVLALTKVPQLAALLDAGTGRLHELGVLPRRAGHLRRALLRRRARRPRVRGNRSARAEPLHHAGQGLPAVRVPLLGPPRDRPHDQQQVLQQSLRWHLLRRPLPALAGLRPSRGAADRFELRRGRQARHPVPQPRSAAERWSRTGCPSSTPTSRARPSACPACRSGRRTSWGTRSPIPRRARRATTASSRRRSWFPSTDRCAKAWACWARPASRSRGRSSATSSSTWGARTSCAAACAAKNIYNTITMALFLLIRWILFFVVTVLYLAAVDLWASVGALAFALATVGLFVFTVAYNVLVERLVRPLQALRPQGCSIYDRAFWRHERFWKLSTDTFLSAFNGTPIKNVLWRLLGVRIGRRVFDDGFGAARADVRHDR